MQSDFLNIERKNCVGVLTLNRPEKANALNAELKKALMSALGELSVDPEVGAILIKGAGKHFCSGQDFKDIALGTRPEDVAACRHTFNHLVTPIFDQINAMGTAVIAAVRGLVTGEGLPLAATCDLVVASENTVFQFPGTNLAGISIGPGVVAARYIGIRKTLEYLLTGEPLLAPEAERLGLVNRVVPDDKLEETALALAQKVGSKALTNPAFIKELGKRVFYIALDMERSKAFKYSHEALANGFCTNEAIEGAKRFLEGKLTKSDLQLEGLVED